MSYMAKKIYSGERDVALDVDDTKKELDPVSSHEEVNVGNRKSFDNSKETSLVAV